MASETGEVFLFLLSLAHPDMTTLNFVNNPTDVIASGETFMAFPFDLTLPDDREDEITRVSVAIDNVDRRVVQAVRSIDSPATVTIRVIRAAEPNVAVAGPIDCTLRNVSVNALTVTGDLHPHQNIQDEIYPQYVFNSATAPALFTGGVVA